MNVVVRCGVALAAGVVGSAGLVAVNASPVGAEPTTCKHTFAAASPAVASPNSTTLVPIPATGAGTVADIDVKLYAETTTSTDVLLVDNADPASSYSELIGGTHDLTATVFDDEATQDLGQGSDPYTGRFKPMTPLSALDGLPVATSCGRARSRRGPSVAAGAR